MNRPTQISETSAALNLKETSFGAPPIALDLDVAQAATTLRPSMEFEWDDFDTGTLDE